MMKLYGCCIKCNGTKITNFKSEQFLKVKGSSAMTFLWQGVCHDTEYGGCTPQCSCVVRGRGSSLLTEMRTSTTAAPHHFGSQLTPCEYILAHIAVSSLPLQPGCCWRKPRYAAALEETPLSDMALGPAERKNQQKTSWILFSLRNKRNAAEDRRPSKALARAVISFTAEKK